MANFCEKMLKSTGYIYADDVAEICKPLFKNFHINYFFYGRLYKDNSALCLISTNKWLDCCIANKYPFLAIFQDGIHMWTSIMKPLALKEGGAYFNFHNGMTIEKVHTNFTEIVEFASPSLDKHPTDFYINNHNLFTQFLYYFKEKAAFSY